MSVIKREWELWLLCSFAYFYSSWQQIIPQAGVPRSGAGLFAVKTVF